MLLLIFLSYITSFIFFLFPFLQLLFLSLSATFVIYVSFNCIQVFISFSIFRLYRYQVFQISLLSYDIFVCSGSHSPDHFHRIQLVCFSFNQYLFASSIFLHLNLTKALTPSAIFNFLNFFSLKIWALFYSFLPP